MERHECGRADTTQRNHQRNRLVPRRRLAAVEQREPTFGISGADACRCEVDRDVQDQLRMPDRLRLVDRPLEHRDGLDGPRALRSETRELDIREDRAESEVRRSERASSLEQHRLGVVEGTPADEKLAEVCSGEPGVCRIAHTLQILLSRRVALGRLVPPSLCVCLHTEVHLGYRGDAKLTQLAPDLERAKLVDGLLGLPEQVVAAVEDDVRACERTAGACFLGVGSRRLGKCECFPRPALLKADVRPKRGEPRPHLGVSGRSRGIDEPQPCRGLPQRATVGTDSQPHHCTLLIDLRLSNLIIEQPGRRAKSVERLVELSRCLPHDAERTPQGCDVRVTHAGESSARRQCTLVEACGLDVCEHPTRPVSGDARIRIRLLPPSRVRVVERQKLCRSIGIVAGRGEDRVTDVGMQLLAPLEREPLVGRVANQCVAELNPPGPVEREKVAELAEHSGNAVGASPREDDRSVLDPKTDPEDGERAQSATRGGRKPVDSCVDETLDGARQRLDIVATSKGVEQLDQEERVPCRALGELVSLPGHERCVGRGGVNQRDRLLDAKRFELETEKRVSLVRCQGAVRPGARGEDEKPRAVAEARL